MATKFKVLLISVCLALFATGFAVSAYAFDPCGECFLNCSVREYQCLQSGTPAGECRDEYILCIRGCDCINP